MMGPVHDKLVKWQTRAWGLVKIGCVVQEASQVLVPGNSSGLLPEVYWGTLP